MDARYMALHGALIKHLKVAAIILDDWEKLHVILEILNTHREPLKEADLVKNMLMYEANVDDDEKKARQLWGTFDVENDWWRCEDGRGCSR